MNFSNEGYDGSLFHDFYVARDPITGPGWFIFGRNKEKYGVSANGKGRYGMLCGYRVHKGARNYNGQVRHGWRTKREALAALTEHLKNYPHLEGKPHA